MHVQTLHCKDPMLNAKPMAFVLIKQPVPWLVLTSVVLVQNDSKRAGVPTWCSITTTQLLPPLMNYKAFATHLNCNTCTLPPHFVELPKPAFTQWCSTHTCWWILHLLMSFICVPWHQSLASELHSTASEEPCALHHAMVCWFWQKYINVSKFISISTWGVGVEANIYPCIMTRQGHRMDDWCSNDIQGSPNSVCLYPTPFQDTAFLMWTF